jgi:FtsZ-binding cell division protein ZapB
MANQQTQSGGGNQMQTGASNLEYDIVAEMHELLEGNAALEQYIQDARQAGDSEAERCFQQIHDQNRQNVAQLRTLLARYLANPPQQQQGQGQMGGGSSTGS